MTSIKAYILPLLAAIFVFSCTVPEKGGVVSSSAAYFEVRTDGDVVKVVTISPFDGKRDSVIITEPMSRVICMSSTLVAGFAEAGAADAVKGVSGKRYISNPVIANDPEVIDVGYEASLNYESILALKPDVVLAYAVNSVEPAYVVKLRSLDIPVLMVYDNFESHPLARAEYIRLCGALSWRMAHADSVFASVSDNYTAIAGSEETPVKVMVNAPYGDAWYVPSKSSYFNKLVEDAGGEILGAEDGLESSLITLETAYSFSRVADVWLNPGTAADRKSLVALHPSFDNFCRDSLRIYNNTLRMNSEGGNDFYERGAVRPDLILRDLKSVFSGDTSDLEYYIEVK